MKKLENSKIQKISDQANLNPFIGAIIAANVYDYVYGSKAMQILERSNASKTSAEYVKCSRMKAEALKFFKSDWFVTLTSGKITADYIIEKCNQAIALDKYGTIRATTKSGRVKDYKYVFCFETLTETELAGFKEILNEEEYKKLESKFKRNIPIKKNIATRMADWAETMVINNL